MRKKDKQKWLRNNRNRLSNNNSLVVDKVLCNKSASKLNKKNRLYNYQKIK